MSKRSHRRSIRPTFTAALIASPATAQAAPAGMAHQRIVDAVGPNPRGTAMTLVTTQHGASAPETAEEGL